MSEYLIQKETLDGIARQSNELMGKAEAVSPSVIIDDLTEANDEVGTQNALIAQIASALEGKAAGGGSGESIPQFSTVRIYLKDIQLSDFYFSPFGMEWVQLECNYIGENFEKNFFEILFKNDGLDFFDKSEVSLTVLTGTSLVITGAPNHFVDKIDSDKYNELYDLKAYARERQSLSCTEGRFTGLGGTPYILVPIYGNTEIRLTE